MNLPSANVARVAVVAINGYLEWPEEIATLRILEKRVSSMTNELSDPALQPSSKTSSNFRAVRSYVLLAVVSLTALGVVAFCYLQRPDQEQNKIVVPATASIRFDDHQIDLVHLKPSTAQAMNVSTVIATRPLAGTNLRLRGQLMLDPSRLVHVHTRFAGEVTTVAEVVENSQRRQLRVGDRVKSGQLLAVLWSKEIGEKKSDLVDAWSKLFLHETILRNLKKIEGGGVAQRTIDEMQRNYEADLIEVTRLSRTLRSWRIDQKEMDEIEKEARRLHQLANLSSEKGTQSDSSQLESHWAEIEVRAPRDGLILEKNFTVGDIVETNLDLFKIADLSRLGVMANAYEEDLPRIDALAMESRSWSIELHSLPNHPPLAGRFESIGHLIDPNQHTAIVTGWIENPEGLMRVGQFVEVIIDLPPDKNVIELPVASILDAGQKAFVFVAKNEEGTEFEKREIKIVRRNSEFVWIEAKNTNPDSERMHSNVANSVEAGERVIVGGVVEINSALTEIQPTEETKAAIAL